MITFFELNIIVISQLIISFNHLFFIILFFANNAKCTFFYRSSSFDQIPIETNHFFPPFTSFYCYSYMIFILWSIGIFPRIVIRFITSMETSDFKLMKKHATITFDRSNQADIYN